MERLLFALVNDGSNVSHCDCKCKSCLCAYLSENCIDLSQPKFTSNQHQDNHQSFYTYRQIHFMNGNAQFLRYLLSFFANTSKLERHV